jgi:hypothetical protein
MKYLFLKGYSGKKKKYYDMNLKLVARFRTGHLSTADEKRSGRPTQVTIPGYMDVIHSMNLDDRRISTKMIAETLAISQERIAFVIHETLDMRSSQPNGSANVSMLFRSVIESLIYKPFWTDFGGFLREL